MSEPLLSASGLVYRPLGHDVTVLDDVSIGLACGEIVDISGPSGSGKTTLLRALARLLPGAAGSITLGGIAAEEIEPRAWRTRVALLPQVATMQPGTVRQNLVLPWTLKVRSGHEPPADAALEAALLGVGLGDISLDRDTAKLSVGQAARISLLRTTLTCPDVLLLDEPDANLDDESAAQVSALTERFARDGGAVARVRHLERSGEVTRRIRLCSGKLEEVAL